MKKYLKYLLLTAGILTANSILRAQEPQQQPQQQQQQINVYPPENPAPPPPPATTNTTTVVTTEKEEHHEGAFMLGFRYMPTLSSFNIQTSHGVADTKFVLSHGFGGFIGVKTSDNFDLQLEVIY